MTKIPFDIKYRPQIESGKYKVETGDKKQVRIICWNRKVNDFPIVALAYDAQKDVEIFINTSVLGEPHTNIASDRLFIVTPEEEFTKWEKAFGLAITDYQLLPRDKDGIANIHDIDEFTKKKAAELLSFAREQFIKDGDVIEKEDFHDAVEKIDDTHKAEMSIEYSLHCKIENGTRHAVMNWEEFQKLAQKFINMGKAGALKDLPRWKKVGLDTGQTTLVVGYTKDEDKLYRNRYVISLSDLEKLPSFKED